MTAIAPLLFGAMAVSLAFARDPAPSSKAPSSKAPSAKAAADRFSLDLAPVEEDAAVTAGEPSGVALTLDTPIAELVADPRGKRVLDRDLPGLSTDKNLDKFKALSLRRLAPQSGGRLTPELLDKVGNDLGGIR